jgi:hypothetical protein
LHGHASDKRAISPRQVVFSELGHIHINEFLRPFSRQHRRYGQKAQRRQGRLLANEFEGMLETPEGVRKLRVDQENFHGFASLAESF